MNVSTYIQFVHRIQPGNGWYVRRQTANVPHREWGNRDPRRIAVSIDFKSTRNVRSQQALADAPVHEEQLAPFLMHNRLAGRPMPNGEPVNVSNFPHQSSSSSSHVQSESKNSVHSNWLRA